MLQVELKELSPGSEKGMEVTLPVKLLANNIGL